MSSTAFQVESFALSDVGVQRENNEDAYGIIEEKEFWVVADGMGGHASGQVASRLAVDNMRRYLTELATRPNHEFTFPTLEGAGPPEILLSNAIQWANERVFIESCKDRKFEGMGTTVVCCMGFDDLMVLGHVGDSRIYRMRAGDIEQLTRDHSLLNHYIDIGRISTPEEIKAFEGKNVIVRALGLKDYVEPEVQVFERRHGDVFLLCTDGLTDQVDDWILTNVLQGNDDDLAEAAAALVSLANNAGGKDNCTVMLLRVTDPEAPETSASQIEELPIDWAEDTALGAGPGIDLPHAEADDTLDPDEVQPELEPEPEAEAEAEDPEADEDAETAPKLPVFTGDERTDPSRDAADAPAEEPEKADS